MKKLFILLIVLLVMLFSCASAETAEQNSSLNEGTSVSEPKEGGDEIISEETYYTVSFYDESGTTFIASQKVKAGEKAEKPNDPSDTATLNNTIYTFVGWYYNGKAFDFNTAISSDITVELKWNKIENSVDIPI